jgi:hypothetical protein
MRKAKFWLYYNHYDPENNDDCSKNPIEVQPDQYSFKSNRYKYDSDWWDAIDHVPTIKEIIESRCGGFIFREELTDGIPHMTLEDLEPKGDRLHG